MVFTGDWNGGERTLTVRRGQFSFKSLSRFRDGGFRPMVADPKLDDQDDYSLDGIRLRWRSRRASDPPFAGTSLRYQMRYALSGILVKEDDHASSREATPPDPAPAYQLPPFLSEVTVAAAALFGISGLAIAWFFVVSSCRRLVPRPKAPKAEPRRRRRDSVRCTH